VQALLQLATATAENKWVLKADELTEQVIRDFSREDGFFYYTSAAQADVPVRKVDVYDGATAFCQCVDGAQSTDHWHVHG
jgi:uncharacterized protein YyaL (SSP411 family)